MLSLSVPLLLLACRAPDPHPTVVPPPDLTQPLAPQEARAGVITDERALFGGIASEGRAGDVKIYNDRVMFVIQGVRPGDYYVSQGGGVIDADIVRDPEEPGGDLVEEWGPMFGIGRLTEPTSVQVLSDGTAGGPATVRVTGRDVAMALVEGALEAPGLIGSAGLSVRTDFVLEPGSWLLEVRTTLTAEAQEVTLPLGDVLLGAPEVADAWTQWIGMGDDTGEPRQWTGYVAREGRGAVALVSAAPDGLSAQGAELITSLTELVVGFGPTETLGVGESLTAVRYYGVGPDLATISEAALALGGEPTDDLAGTVVAPDGPVDGASVNVLVDGKPFTVARTDAAGAFRTAVPAGATTTLLASGRGAGLFLDLPHQAGCLAPYAATPIVDDTLGRLRAGGEPQISGGRGVAHASDPLALGAPARLTVAVDQGGPFEVRLLLQEADEEVDRALFQDRPRSGVAAAGWARDGDVELRVEPGTYDLVVHRGIRYELHTEAITLEAGDERTVTASLPAAYEHPGWLLGDPHAHASPSGDGQLPMEHRLLVHAGTGVQVHFGTDHDHVADYRPLVDALGLTQALTSVVADEVSPPLRGHFNIYPIAAVPKLPNGGAWSWWDDPPSSTEAFVAVLRDRFGADFVLQTNHPTSTGLAETSRWSEGSVGKADFWTNDVQAVEVLNDGSTAGLAFWWDLVLRGWEATPVGVSDSHGHFGGDPGLNGTFLHAGVDEPGDLTDGALLEAIRGGRTVVTRGIYLELSTTPGTTEVGSLQLEVEARSPSWIGVDRLQLWRDGALVEEVPGTQATFHLASEVDAAYVVIAEGDAPMAPVYAGRTPWAMSGAYRIDADGDGWEPPLPPLTME